MIGRGRGSTAPASSDRPVIGDGPAIGGAVLSEIEVLRIDATCRALPDHDSRPDGPSASIDRSLMAAASIQASINRQRRRVVETPAPPQNRGLTWLASLTAFVIALVVLGLAWEMGEKAYYATPAPAVLTVGSDARPVSTGPSSRDDLASPAGAPTTATPASQSSQAATASPAIEGRRPLYSRDRPAARHFGEATSAAGAEPTTGLAAAGAGSPGPMARSPTATVSARDAWSSAPVTFP